MKSSTRRAVFAAVALGAVFYAGWLVGTSASSSHPLAPDLELTRAELIEALDPTPAQRAQLEAIVGRLQSESRSVMGELLGEVRDLSRVAEREMREVLTPLQREALDTLLTHPSVPEGRRRGGE